MYRLFCVFLCLMVIFNKEIASDEIDVFISSLTSIQRYQNGTFTPVIERKNSRITALVVDGRSGLLFWSDVSLEHRGIYKTNTKEFSPVDILYKDVSMVNGLTVDTLYHLVYWTDEWRQTVEVGGYDGSYRAIIVSSGLSLPRPILVVEETRFLYWGDQGTGSIERSRLDGSDRRTIVNDTLWPNTLAWDEANRYLIWTDGWLNHVSKCDKGGGNKSLIMDLSVTANNSSLFGIAVGENQYLITIMDGRVLSVPANETTQRAMNYLCTSNETKATFAITTWNNRNSSVFGYPVKSTCSGNIQEPCSHLCLPGTTSKHQCTCPRFGGLSLVNGTTCKVPATVLLFVSTNGDIGFFDLNKPIRNQHTMISKSRKPMELAYDPVEQMVYYSDVEDKTIYRVRFNGTGKEMFLGLRDGIDLVTDMAVDFQRRNLYFTNYGVAKCNGTEYSWNRIEMVNLQDSSKRFLISTDIIRPHALTLDLLQRWIYVVGRNDTSETVWRMALDGSQRARIPFDLGVGVSVISLPILRYKKGSYLTVATSNQTSNQSTSLLQLWLISGDDIWNETLSLVFDEFVNKTPTSVASFRSHVYVSVRGEDLFGSYDTESGAVNVLESGVTIKKMVATDQSLSAINTWNLENSTCSDHCDGSCVPLPVTLNQVTESCLCSTKTVRVSYNDSQTCEEPDVWLVLADVDSVKSLPLGEYPDDESFIPHPVHRQTTTSSNIVGLVYEENTERLYFTDNERGSIYSVGKNGEILVQFYNSRSKPNDTNSHQTIDYLALDRTSSPWRLLWTSYNKGLICAMSTSGDSATYEEILNHLDNPRALVVDEISKRMYWSECGLNAAVRGATLDGESTFTVVKVGFMWPNSIVLHPETRQLFVADGEGGAIYQCGSEEDDEWKCNILESESAGSHIFSMVFYEDALYLTSWESQSVDRFDLATRSRVKAMEGFTRPCQLALVRKRKVPQGCNDNRSNCGHSVPLDGQRSSVNPIIIAVPIAAGVLVVLLVAAICWKIRKGGNFCLRSPQDGDRKYDDTRLFFSKDTLFVNSEFQVMTNMNSTKDE